MFGLCFVSEQKMAMLSTNGKSISSVVQKWRVFTQSQRLTSRCVATSCQHHAKPSAEEGPIPFSTSKAASWSMTKTLIAPKRDVPWYQAWSISFSMAAFLLYFMFLREENDLDVELNYSLFERVPELEEHQVKVALDYYRKQGKDTRDLEKRLAEIQRDKQLQKKQES